MPDASLLPPANGVRWLCRTGTPPTASAVTLPDQSMGGQSNYRDPLLARARSSTTDADQCVAVDGLQGSDPPSGSSRTTTPCVFAVPSSSTFLLNVCLTQMTACTNRKTRIRPEFFN